MSVRRFGGFLSACVVRTSGDKGRHPEAEQPHFSTIPPLGPEKPPTPNLYRRDETIETKHTFAVIRPWEGRPGIG